MIVARTLDNLVTVQNNIKSRLQKELKLSAEEAAGRILVQAGDISNPKDLINIRDKVVQGETLRRLGVEVSLTDRQNTCAP